jgi:hypothetical protein
MSPSFHAGDSHNEKPDNYIFEYFFPRLKLSINYDKNGLGCILGDFFKTSSSYPGGSKQIAANFDFAQEAQN